ncbi:MAG: metalloregulator ArsR/SmtB family transcription factor [Geminicoccaceae bacterium]
MELASSSLEEVLSGLRAGAEPSRLRLLAICAQGEWTVSELTQVMAQSQPRISRHLKLLAEAGLLDRVREGSWVFYRRAQNGPGARVARSLCRLLPDDDPALQLDRQRLSAVREARRRVAERYFDGRAKGWDSERDLAVDGSVVEAALTRLFEDERPENLLDVGTGTGRILQVLAPHVGFGLGIDLSHDMLAVARANLDRRLARNCQVRHGDMYQLPVQDETFAAVTLHQVLHFADDPPAVLAEARRVLRPGGRLVVIDLARHELEWLRSDRRHRRLGFSAEEMAEWFTELGLEPAAPVELPGPELTVTIWSARRPAAPARDRSLSTRSAA